jgi:hypothetical protein
MEFHRDPRYAGDLHRADMAWARHAVGMGLSAGGIRAEIMRARDLSEKGNESEDFIQQVERTFAQIVANPEAERARRWEALLRERSGAVSFSAFPFRVTRSMMTPFPFFRQLTRPYHQEVFTNNFTKW